MQVLDDFIFFLFQGMKTAHSQAIQGFS